MEDRDLVASLATRAAGRLPPRPDIIPPIKPRSTFVGEISDADIKQVIGFYGMTSAGPEAAGDAPGVRIAVHRVPGGRAAVIVGAIGDAGDVAADWAPFDVERSRSLLAGLRCRAGLEGRDVEALANLVCYLSWMAHEAPFIATLDFDRVAVLETGKGCLVVAARARFGSP